MTIDPVYLLIAAMVFLVVGYRLGWKRGRRDLASHLHLAMNQHNDYVEKGLIDDGPELIISIIRKRMFNVS